MRREIQHIAGAADLRQGWAVVAEVTSRGGIQYQPATIENDENTRIVTHEQVIDDEELDKWVTQTRNAVHNMIRQHTTHTDIGVWFADAKGLDAIEAEIDAYRKTIIKINRQARSLRSKRETRCEYFAFPWEHNDLKLRLRIGQLIYSRLVDLREAYTDKRKDRYRIELDKCRNLDRLVTGRQSDLVRKAINATVDQRPLIIRNYGGSNVPLEVRKTSLRDLAFDYEPIDAAISEFAPAADLFVFELPDLGRTK